MKESLGALSFFDERKKMKSISLYTRFLKGWSEAKPSIPKGFSRAVEFTTNSGKGWSVRVVSKIISWVLSYGYWSDGGLWVDEEEWRDL